MKKKDFFLLALICLIVPSIAWAQIYTYNGKEYDYKLSFHNSIEDNYAKKQDIDLYVSRNGFITYKIEGHEEITCEIKNEICKIGRNKTESKRNLPNMYARKIGGQAYDNYIYLYLGHGILFSTVVSTFENLNEEKTQVDEDCYDEEIITDDHQFRLEAVDIAKMYFFVSEHDDDNIRQIQEMYMLVEEGSFIKKESNRDLNDVAGWQQLIDLSGQVFPPAPSLI